MAKGANVSHNSIFYIFLSVRPAWECRYLPHSMKKQLNDLVLTNFNQVIEHKKDHDIFLQIEIQAQTMDRHKHMTIQITILDTYVFERRL